MFKIKIRKKSNMCLKVPMALLPELKYLISLFHIKVILDLLHSAKQNTEQPLSHRWWVQEKPSQPKAGTPVQLAILQQNWHNNFHFFTCCPFSWVSASSGQIHFSKLNRRYCCNLFSAILHLSDQSDKQWTLSDTTSKPTVSFLKVWGYFFNYF